MTNEPEKKALAMAETSASSTPGKVDEPPPRGGRHLFFRRVKLLAQERYFSLELRPGLHGIVIESGPTAARFIESAAGIAFPLRGRVTWGRLSPGESPTLRKNVGSLLPLESPLLDAPKVRDHVQHVLDLRAQLDVATAATAEEVPFIGALLDAHPATLSNAQRRRVALGLAMTLRAPIALMLYDPLQALTNDEMKEFLERLDAFESDGVTIVCVTPTERAARRLTARVQRLFPEASPSRSAVFFLIRSERPRELAGLLSSEQTVISTRVDPEIQGELTVEVRDEEEGAAAITKAIALSGVELFEMRRTFQSRGIYQP